MYPGYPLFDKPRQLTDVQKIRATCGAFAALRQSGSVVTWGHKTQGQGRDPLHDGAKMKVG